MRRALSVASALLLASGVASAEEAPTDVDDEIVVQGTRTGSFDPIPAASTDVISPDAFRAENKSLADLLDESAGVHVRRFGGAGDRSEVSIRGSTSSQVVVTLDGVRMNSALTGGLDLSRVCLPLIAQVEVVRGAGSSRVGQGAIGGAVNLATRAAGPRPETRAAFRGGAFDTYEGSLLHAGRVGGLDYSVGYCGFGTEGDFDFVQPRERSDGVSASFEPRHATRLNNDRTQHDASLGLGHALGPGRLEFSDYFVHSEGGEPGFDGASDPTAGQNTEARSRDFANTARLAWRGAPPPALGDDLELALHHRYEDSAFDDDAVLFGPPIDVRARLHRLGARERSRWRRGGETHAGELLLQLDGGHERLRASDRRGREREAAGGTLEGTLDLWQRRVQLSASGRVEWTDGFGFAWLPHAGLVVTPWPWLRLRAHGGRAYRVPNFDELFHPDEGFVVGNPDLDPEDAWSLDAGVELVFAELGPLSDVVLGATAFRREIEESIVWLQVGPTTRRPENTGRATASGVEVSAELAWTRFVGLSANHTELDSRRDATRRRLPGQPERETFVRLRVGDVEAWKLVGELQHVGEFGVNEGGSRVIRERTVWNASAAWNVAAWPGLGLERFVWDLWLFFELNNVGDVAVRDSAAFPQPGRHANAGVEVHW